MFGGEYKSKRNVSLGGASKKEKRSSESLIHRNQTERDKREELRRKCNSALKIQAFVRGYWIRQNEYNIRRKEFDVIMAKSERTSPDFETIHSLLRYLLFFFSNSKDSERLIKTCQLLLKSNKNLKIQDYLTWTFQIKHFLSLCSRYLKEALYAKKSFALPLRVLEVFTSNEWYTMLKSHGHAEVDKNVTVFLVKNGYFRHLRVVMEERIPPSLESSSGVSTPLADTLVDLILRPVKQACSFTEDQPRTDVLCSFVEDFFVPKLSEQIKFFLLPKLQDPKNFPFEYLLQSLKTSSFFQSHTNLDLLYCILTLAQTNLETLPLPSVLVYLEILVQILIKLPQKGEIEDSDDESACNSSQKMKDSHESDMLACCMDLLNLRSHVHLLLTLTLNQRSDEPNANKECVKLLCLICNSLIFEQKCQIHQTRLLLILAFNKTFLKRLWELINNASLQTNMGKQVSLLHMITYGNNLRNWEAECIAPLLSVFCFLFSRLLFSLHDMDFFPQDSDSIPKVPFTLEDLSGMGRTLSNVTLGVINIMNHEIRTSAVPNYGPPSTNTRSHSRDMLRENGLYTKDQWNEVLEAMTFLVKQLYSRDTRLHYCPTNYWLSPKVDFNVEMIDLDMFFQEQETKEGDQETRDVLKGTSGKTFSHVAILEHIPFVVPFVDRVKLFHRILAEDSKRNVGNMHDFLMGPSLEVRIRRNSLYQDAFDELGGHQDLKQKVHVKLINLQGLEEAGVDGGGLFREFLNECLKAGFDQNIGFFTSTHKQLLYPNPQSYLVERNVLKHYYFLGRMLGKAIYENMLVELPFASFFLCKLLSKTNADVDINHLESLDPEMSRNLLFLKNCSDVQELALNFTVVNNSLGETQVVELKAGGKDIMVTNQNRIEYIHLMADYRLNKQIRPHCNAFRSGISSLIDISWLRMFDHNEIQVLISGAQVPIDVEDLRNHTAYSGGLDENHICVQYFWEVVSSFDDVQRRQLLKFVTSCSRPPLLGFKDLHPPFTIHTAGFEDRLPTASTCVNLLKLPEYKDLETMRQKLLYSLESGAGFELS